MFLLYVQERLVARMALDQDADLALEYARMFRLDPSAAQVLECQVAASAAVRVATFLQLDIPNSAVLFVDSDERLAEAAALLEGAAMLGLDTEWQAPLVNGNGNCNGNHAGHPLKQQVSILQVMNASSPSRFAFSVIASYTRQHLASTFSVACRVPLARCILGSLQGGNMLHTDEIALRSAHRCSMRWLHLSCSWQRKHMQYSLTCRPCMGTPRWTSC